MNLRSRRHKTAVALMVVIALILLGYGTKQAKQGRRAGGARVSGGNYLVEYVYDGDSLRLENGAEVRLVGIDTPEKGREMSDEGRNFAKDMLESRTVRLVSAEEPVDKYGRNLAYLYLTTAQGELLVNAEMARLGYAYAWPYKPNTTHSAEILAAQKEAQAAHRGLWARKPGKSGYYLVERRRKYSLTHRPNCPKLKGSNNSTRRFDNRLQAINSEGGAPPCRDCRP